MAPKAAVKRRSGRSGKSGWPKTNRDRTYRLKYSNGGGKSPVKRLRLKTTLERRPARAQPKARAQQPVPAEAAPAQQLVPAEAEAAPTERESGSGSDFERDPLELELERMWEARPLTTDKCVGESLSGDLWLASTDASYPKKSVLSRQLFDSPNKSDSDDDQTRPEGRLQNTLFSSDSEDERPLLHQPSQPCCSSTGLDSACVRLPSNFSTSIEICEFPRMLIYTIQVYIIYYYINYI